VPAGARNEVIDALRGIALFGILAVNIQAYLFGIGSSPLGTLDENSSVADHLAVLLTGFFLHYKFYPIFCFCFGYGFAVQTRRWLAGGLDAQRLFARRTEYLLGMGIIHGAFLWFGDILTSYALAGKVLARHIGKGPRRLIPILKFWLVMFLIAAIPLTILMSPELLPGPEPLDTAGRHGLSAEARQAFDAYAKGTYLDALAQRCGEYVMVTLGFVLILPEIMVIFLVGAITAQLGLVRRRAQFRARWRRLLHWALIVGVPINLWHAWALWNGAHSPSRPASLLEALPADFAPLLAVAYVAFAVLAADTAWGRRVIGLFAPAGRLALSNYVLQSILMAALLSGFGLGLGADLKQAALLQTAMLIYLLQLLASHLMTLYSIAGPLESGWRRHTYRRPRPTSLSPANPPP
jgi:uncharacterized protein